MNKNEKGWLKLAESSFSEWNNSEDSIYDTLVELQEKSFFALDNI